MALRGGDRGEPVKTLQRDLNKLGFMVLVDGHFGACTRNAVVGARDRLGRPGPPEADDDLQQALAAVSDPFPPLTAAGVTFIAREEVSDATAYQQRFQAPIARLLQAGSRSESDTTAGSSGAASSRPIGTISAGPAVAQLVPVLGKEGSPGLLGPLSNVVVPLGAAMRVFTRRSLPKHFARTRSIYPQVEGDALTAAQRTALVSLVYNRGT